MMFGKNKSAKLLGRVVSVSYGSSTGQRRGAEPSCSCTIGRQKETNLHGDRSNRRKTNAGIDRSIRQIECGARPKGFYSIAFRKKLYGSLEEVQADVDSWLREYNENRPHSGKYCFGKTSMQTFLEAKHLAHEKALDRSFVAISFSPREVRAAVVS